MTAQPYSKIITYASPGELRAALLDKDGRPCRLFIERWGGAFANARFGSVHSARLRKFSEEIKGAFVELETGEEALLRLGLDHGLTEGQKIHVKTVSEARSGKLARVKLSDQVDQPDSAFALWQQQVLAGEDLPIEEDWDGVEAAFEDALVPSVPLANGGRIFIDRTRALTALDIDSAGRKGKGSAGAKALSLNRDAVSEMVRQIGVRGLGGIFVLDCVEPLNQKARDTLKAAAREAFAAYGFEQARIVAPSTLGLLEAAIAWSVCPLEDKLKRNPPETELLKLFRDIQREAAAMPSALFDAALSKSLWQAYLDRKSEAHAALKEHFGGRLTLRPSDEEESRVIKR